MIIFNDGQLNAIKNAIEWYFCRSFKQNLFVISGIAGSGKTTILRTIIKMISLEDHNVIFATLTGKAALVLRMNGNPANTIHKSFYVTHKSGGTFKFRLKKEISPLIKLIVVDEMSMVNQKMLDDITSFGIPVIALYDPVQLEPIFGTNIYMEDWSKADVSLTQPMRQTDESGILDIATLAREGKPIPYGMYKKSEVTTFDKVEDRIQDFDIVICWKNSTRRRLNQYIRKKKGFSGIYPQKGEKIVCLQNNYNYEIEFNDIPIYLINGLQGYVTQDAVVRDSEDVSNLKLEFVPDFIYDITKDESLKFDTSCYREVFDQYNINIDKEPFIKLLNDSTLDDGALDLMSMVDFGYSMTVFKVQGSSFDNVLVLNEFRGTGLTYDRMLYSAVTRAKKSVTIATL